MNNKESNEMNERNEDSMIRSPPVIHELSAVSTRSETTLAPTQPRIDALPDQSYVTRKDCLDVEPAWIDCDFCQKRTKTRVERIKLSNDNEGILACLLCLVCPCLICLAFMGDNGEDINHYCTGANCGRKVTHKGPKGPVQVLKPPTPIHEVTKYGVAAMSEGLEMSDERTKFEHQK